MKSIFIFVLILTATIVIAQNKGIEKDIVNLQNTVFYKSKTPPNYSSFKADQGVVKKIFSGLFMFYKKNLSSQDASNCPFTVSCSVYMMQSLQKKGFVAGFLNGIDRYQRCNGKSGHKYDHNPLNNKLIDNVE